MDDVDEALVVVVIDCNESAWIERARTAFVSQKPKQSEHLLLPSLFDIILLFMKAVLLLNQENKVAVLASLPSGKYRYLFPDKEKYEENSRAEGILELVSAQQEYIEEIFTMAIRGLGAELDKVENSLRNTDSNLHSALGAALCFCNKVIKEQKESSLDRVLLQPRILLIQVTKDNPAHYIASMNASFAAQKLKIPIDACDLTLKGSTLLRQISHLSKGLVIKPRLDVTATALSQMFWSVFLPDCASREKLKLPDQPPIILKTSCFCHNRLVDQGFVCSVCLSVFCKTALECPTCGNRVRIQR